MGPHGKIFGLQQTAPPRVGTGSRGSKTNRSGSARAGARSASTPSPSSELAAPPLERKKRRGRASAGGHSSASLQTFDPITNSRAGGGSGSDEDPAPFTHR